MDVQVRERLVGALVLVALVVLFVPALLKGPERARDTGPAEESRTVEVRLDDATAPEPDEDLVPEPATPSPAMPVTETAAAPGPAPARDKPAPPASSATSPATTAAPVTAAASADAVPTTTPAWAVQLGAFSTRDKAERLVADLRRRGYAAFVLEYRARGQVLHRVRVGPEQDRDRAAAIAERLRKYGFLPVVAPHP